MNDRLSQACLQTDNNVSRRMKFTFYLWHYSPLLSTEMDFLRRSCRISRLEHVRNEVIRERAKVVKSIIDDIDKKQLTWFGHVKRMEERRWPRKILEWDPPERRKRGRPRRSQRENVQEAMDARELDENTCYDRKKWKLGAEKRRQLQQIRYIYIKK